MSGSMSWWGDLKDPSNMDPFPKDIDVAYYLVHSMAEKITNLLKTEENTAEHFVAAVNKTECKQVIYLGGIIDKRGELSEHLQSRLNVENVLKKGKAPLTVLRASIIIGAGSASFEIIRDLVEKLPFMVAPKWVESRCQPIGIVDVLYYLSHAALKPQMYHKTYDIGGPEAMTFKQVLMRYAAFRKLKRFIFDISFMTPKLSSYWLVFITSVR
jgi:uncharacterized protein YbjT (DUF2867 family)